MFIIANDFRYHVLKTAYEYETWLRENKRGSSYSTFLDEFGYVGDDQRKVYNAVEIVRRDALAEAVG